MKTFRKKTFPKALLFLAILTLIPAGAAFGDPFGIDLFRDVKKGNFSRLKKDLSEGGKVDGRDEFGQTPLMVAVGFGRLEMEKFLIRSGADVNARNKFGRTPLMVATRMGHRSIAVLLIKSGADIRAKDDQGETSLMIAAGSGQLGMAKLLLRLGARIDERDRRGQTPLMVAIRHTHPRMVDFLIKSKADVNARNNQGVTPLMLSAITGSLHETRSLVLAGGRIEDRDHKGRNALSYAKTGQDKIVLDYLKKISAVPASRPVVSLPEPPGKDSQSQSAARPVSP